MALYAFDGTWNYRDRKEAIERVQSPQYGIDRAAARDTIETNVSRFREFYGSEQSEYLQGVGTRFSWVGAFLGGAFGMGGKYRIRRMYRSLTKRYFAGDTEINLVGFSRGAALAVHFANVLSSHGLRDPANPRHLAWKHFPDLGWTFRHPKATVADVKAPAIHFLGLFDTVATFGWPIWPFRNRGKWWKVWKIPRNVRGTFHAMALDEVRATFALIRPRLAEREEGDPEETVPTLYEIWFRGVHSNIGGGYLDRGLSDIALAWMMEMAVFQWRKVGQVVPKRFEEALRMLEPEAGPLPQWVNSKLETLEPDPDGALGRAAKMGGQAWRELPGDPLVHHSVVLRQKSLVSDHGGANRPLLRRIPRNAQWINDPPLFYRSTRNQIAAELAYEAFARVPVRPRDWLKQGNNFIFRSDHWIALGSARGRDDDPIEQTSREAFLEIAKVWLLSDRPDDPETISLTRPIHDWHGAPITDVARVKRWIVDVLLRLEPYMPVRPELE